MTARFVDTSYFLALLIPGDQFHDSARSLAVSWRGNLVTTDYVLLEVANHLSSPTSRSIYVDLYHAISREPRMNIVAAMPAWMHRGMALYEARPDKAWSLTDCISFTVMAEFELHEALTADRHYIQAGFEILMK